MLKRGAASKLVIYVNEREKYQGKPLFESVVSFLQQHNCAGATVTKAVAGYGSSGRMHEAHLFHLSEDVPMRIEAIDSEQKIAALLPFLYDMVGSGLIEVQETEVIKHATHEVEEEEEALKHEKLEGQAKMLRIYIGEDDRWEGEPLHEAIVKKLRMMDIAGATVYRGLMGYGAQQRLHKPGWLGLSTDLPIMISIIDTEEKIKGVLPMLDEMVDEGLVVLSDVEIIKYTHKSRDESGGMRDESIEGSRQ